MRYKCELHFCFKEPDVSVMKVERMRSIWHVIRVKEATICKWHMFSESWVTDEQDDQNCDCWYWELEEERQRPRKISENCWMSYGSLRAVMLPLMMIMS